MYAIVDIAGQQFKVEKDTKVFAHRLEGKEGSKVTFDKVLLLEENGKVSVGTPTVAGATVSAKIVSHLKDGKVIVFKKKRRKGYQKQNGHRQALTELVIEGISAKGGAAKAEKKEAAPKAEAAPVAEVKSDETE
jgi:large subunit ribosomal protein L21